MTIGISLQWHPMSVMASQITGKSTVCLGWHQRKHQSPRHWSFVRGIHRCKVDSLHKGPVTRLAFPCHDVIMYVIMTSLWTNIPGCCRKDELAHTKVAQWPRAGHWWRPHWTGHVEQSSWIPVVLYRLCGWAQQSLEVPLPLYEEWRR